MALTAPTTTATPVTQAEANAAFTVMNGYVTDAYTESLAALAFVREHIKLLNGSVMLLDELDTNIRVLQGSSLPDPSVASDPGTKAQVNNALVTMASFVDRLNSRVATTLNLLRTELRISDGSVLRLQRFDTATTNIASPASLTAEAVSTDVGPGTVFTEVNTALANTTAFIDNANTEIVAFLNEFVEQSTLRYGFERRYQGLKDAIAAMS